MQKIKTEKETGDNLTMCTIWNGTVHIVEK